MTESFPLLHDPPGHDEPKPGWFRIPVFGWAAAYTRQLQIEGALVKQAIERGPVPESVWDAYDYDMRIRREIESIVTDLAFPKGSTFHPLDPVELMFVLRYGDLNEVQIVMNIEDRLGFAFDDELCNRLIAKKTTFIEFIKMIEANSNSE